MLRILLIAACFMSFGGASAERDVQVGVGWNPVGPSTIEAYPVVRAEPISNKGVESEILNRVADDNGWRFSFEAHELRLLTKLTVDLEGEIPAGYEYAPLTVAAPYYGGTVKVFATPTTVDLSENTVVRLFATNPREKSPSDLFKMYQETWAVARQRMSVTSAPGARIEVFDVQAVYKFLETAYVMTEDTEVVLARDVADGYNWLEWARKTDPDVVRRGLEGFDEEAKKILFAVSELESIPYGRLWRQISKVECKDGITTTDAVAKIARIEQFYLTLIRKLAMERRKRIVDAIGVNRVTAENDANQCARLVLENPDAELHLSKIVLTRRLKYSEEAIEEYGDETLAEEQLVKSVKYLRTLESQMEKLPGWF